jgi:hypothetical protein
MAEEIDASAEVSNNEAENRFELHIGGQMAFLAYGRTPRRGASGDGGALPGKQGRARRTRICPRTMA